MDDRRVFFAEGFRFSGVDDGRLEQLLRAWLIIEQIARQRGCGCLR